MGAALLFLRHDESDLDAERSFDAAAAEFPSHVRILEAEDLAAPGLRVRVWSDASRTPAVARDAASDAWLVVVGNPTRPDLRGLSQRDVLDRLLRECLVGGPRALETVSPPFVAILHAAGSDVVIAVDRCGIQHAYLCEEAHGRVWLSSSSLSLAAALGCQLDTDGLAEWLAVGHFLTGRTLFRGIRKLECGERVRVAKANVVSEAAWAPNFDGDRRDNEGSYRRCFLESLRACYRPEPVAMELTGGLDTRLLLAGQIELRLPSFSWTIGQDGCDELQTIAKLKRSVAFDHYAVHVDSRLGSRIPSLARQMHALSDGEVNALEYAPLLVAFEELDKRRSVSVTGSGGENARGFYFRVLRRKGDRLRGVPTDALFRQITKFTGGVRHDLQPSVAADPDEVTREAIREFVAASPGRSPEDILEDFYIRTRMKRFAGRNITTTGLFCRQGLPFFANDLVEVTNALPVELKRDGRVVRESIAALNPKLASIPLDTGIPVPPPSLHRPDVTARRFVSLARRGLEKFGGRVGHALAARPPETIPWHAVRGTTEFRDLLRDVLGSRDAKVCDLFKEGTIETRVAEALDGGSLYPVGLLLTLELTLQRLGSPSARAAQAGA